jgi:TIR domain
MKTLMIAADGQEAPEMAGASPKTETATEDRKGLQPTAIAASIFISYASKDERSAHTICNALEHRGFGCWIADRDIGPGENFQVAIVHAIRSAKVMILVFSANSTNSEEIKKEVVLAGQSRLVVIPVRVEDVTPDEAFAYEMATRQWIDLFGDWEQSIQRLVRQLETVTHIKPDLKVAADTPIAEQDDPGSHKEPLAPSFPEPARSRHRRQNLLRRHRKAVIAAVVMLLLSFAGYLAGQ